MRTRGEPPLPPPSQGGKRRALSPPLGKGGSGWGSEPASRCPGLRRVPSSSQGKYHDGKQRRSIMRIRGAGRVVVAVVAVGLLALSLSQAALAQVNLLYNFPEGETVAYQTTAKPFQ